MKCHTWNVTQTPSIPACRRPKHPKKNGQIFLPSRPPFRTCLCSPIACPTLGNSPVNQILTRSQYLIIKALLIGIMFGKLCFSEWLSCLGPLWSSIIFHGLCLNGEFSLFPLDVPLVSFCWLTKLGTSSLGYPSALSPAASGPKLGVWNNMLSVEFLSPQNGSAWKWGPTSRQTPFLVTPGILGNLRRGDTKGRCVAGGRGWPFCPTQNTAAAAGAMGYLSKTRSSSGLCKGVCVCKSLCV